MQHEWNDCYCMLRDQGKGTCILKADNLQIGYVRHSLAEIQERKKVLKKKIVKQRAAMGGLSAAEKQDVKVKSSMVLKSEISSKCCF